MKKIIIYSLILICVSSISTHIMGMDIDPLTLAVEKKQEKEAIHLELPKKCNSLILLLDPKQKEQLHRGFGALGETLAAALIEKAAPIIATTSIIQNFCSWKINPTLQTDPFRAPTFATIDLNDKDWHCYAHKRAGLMLLIPKNYCTAPFLQKANVDEKITAEQCAELCDFDIKNLDIINNVSPNGIVEYINQHKTNYTHIVTHIESMFIKPHLITSYSPSWNIFLCGHGSTIGREPFISLTPLTKKEELQRLEAQLARERVNQDELEEQLEIAELFDDPSSERATLERSSRKIKKIQNKMRKIRKTSEETESISPDEKEKNILKNMLSIRSRIAGLRYDKFLKLLSFFERGIKTSYVHYTSCFTGGFNQTLVSKILSQLNVGFIVSSQGINEQSTHPFDIREVRNRMSFTRFFTILKDFFCNPVTFVTSRSTQKALPKDPISAILSTIIEPSHENYPFVRIPAVGVFNAFTVDKKVKIVTNTIARAHEHEGTVLDFTHPDIESIIVYPTYIGAPLAIKENVFIAFPVPQKWTQSEEKIHIFEKIFYKDRLSSIIPHCTYLNSSYNPITFVIKKLHCLDNTYSGLNVGDGKPISIENVIITMQGHGAEATPNVDINVIFSCNNNTYFYSQKINELAQWQNKEKKDNPLFYRFKKESALPITPAKLHNVAIQILGAHNIENLQGQAITLPLIVEQLEKRIDKTVMTEKPGNLKRVLLEKKSRSLTKQLSQEELEEQRLWRTKIDKDLLH